MAKLRSLTLDLTPLRTSRDFRLLWSGLTVSAIGSMMTRVAVPLQIYDLTHSNWKVGLVGGATLVPTLVCSIIGGAIADVVDRRRMILTVLGIGSVVSLLLAANSASGTPRLWALYVLAALSSASGAIGGPAHRSAVPLMLPAEQIPAAMAVQSLTFTSAAAIGPALAGVFFRTIGPSWTYLIDAISFGVCFLGVTGMRPIARVTGGGERFHPRLVLEGFSALRGRHAVQGSFAADFVAMVFGMPTALFPAVADARFAGHKELVGLLYAAIPTGMILATVFSGWTRRVSRHGRVVVCSIIVWGVAITFFGLVGGIVTSLVCLAVAGAADMTSGVSRQAMLQLATPPHLQGRMQGVGMAVWIGGPSVGDLEAGVLASVTTVDTSIVVGGVGCVAGIVTLAAALPAFRRFDARTDHALARGSPEEVQSSSSRPS
jgi:MFS family permease